MSYETVRESDPAAADALEGERGRQNDTLAMIASENHVSEAVLEAQSSELTNNYAEGYPGERYYGGCEYADDIEQLAIDRATELWGAGPRQRPATLGVAGEHGRVHGDAGTGR